MRKRFTFALIAAVAVAGVMLERGRGDASPVVAGENAGRFLADSIQEERQERDRAIAFYSRRLTEDPASALDLAQLAAHHLQRSRETGSNADLLLAEDAARRSLALRVNRNAGSYVILASTLLAQHRFRDAELAARSAVDYDPEERAYWSLYAEVLMERGEYTRAAAAFDSVRRGPPTLTSSSRLARWAELNGKIENARKLLRDCITVAQSRRDLTREQRAWYHLQLGAFEARHGRMLAADSALHVALGIAPTDRRVLAALARLEADRGHWLGAITYADSALIESLEPGALAVLSDAYQALGDTLRAEEFADGVRLAALGQKGPIHRDWALFLLDRGMETKEILARAVDEMRDRHDVHTQEVYAWALHKNGQDAAAEDAMTKALALQTPSASMFYHLGVIRAARGDTAGAIVALEKSRAHNPYHRAASAALSRLPRK